MTGATGRSRNAVPRNENVSPVCACRICAARKPGERMPGTEQRRSDGVVDAVAVVVVVVSLPAPACLVIPESLATGEGSRDVRGGGGAGGERNWRRGQTTGGYGKGRPHRRADNADSIQRQHRPQPIIGRSDRCCPRACTTHNVNNNR